MSFDEPPFGLGVTFELSDAFDSLRFSFFRMRRVNVCVFFLGGIAGGIALVRRPAGAALLRSALLAILTLYNFCDASHC